MTYFSYPFILLLYFLVYAMLSKNRLTGSLPSEFGSLTMMETFYADLNEISGTLPPEIGKLQELGKHIFLGT
jgi:hypothetical protein